MMKPPSEANKTSKYDYFIDLINNNEIQFKCFKYILLRLVCSMWFL